MYKTLVAALAVLATTNALLDSDPNTIITCRENGQDGECVPYYLCNKKNEIKTDGSEVIDIRFNEDALCPSYLQKCCHLQTEDRIDQPLVPNRNTPQREGCGWHNPQGVGMKTKGDVNEEAKFGEFPWIVAILKVEPLDAAGRKQVVFIGGGSLINPGVVLTTAHILSGITEQTELRVRAGEWDTQITTEIYPHQERTVASLIKHKDFNPGNLFYDIALLFLSTPMDLAPNVGVACLPPPGQNRQVYQPPPPGTRCLAAGWGKDKFGKEGHYQVILKKVDVPVVSFSNCQNALRNTRLGGVFELHKSFMCAGGEPGRDTCRGDGGSPLVCPIPEEEGRFVQNGIVSWGIGCGDTGTPGVYVDVANLRNWIDDKVRGQGYYNESSFLHYSYAYTPNQ